MPMPSTGGESVNALTPPRSTLTSGSARAATASATEASWPRSDESSSSPPPQTFMEQLAVATGVPAVYAHPVESVHGAWPDLEPQQQPHAPTALWRQEEPLRGYAFVGLPAPNLHFEQQDPRHHQQQQEPAETDNLIALSSSPPNN
ncbi:unnamed protein product [Ectocarpus sp. 4 AP-2014]